MRLRWIADELWRGRAWLLAAGVAAIVAGILLAFRVSLLPPQLEARRYDVAAATVLAVVDTPQSQAIDLSGSTGVDVQVLSDRAKLLADLVTQAPMTQRIAARAGVPARLLVGVPEKRLGKQIDEGPQVLGAAVDPDDRRAFVVRAKVPILLEGATPIIEITTRAPDRARAARLADATVAAMQARVREVASAERIPEPRAITVRQLSSPRLTAVAHGLGAAGAMLAALLVFGAGCGAVLLGSLLRSNWRRSAELTDPRPPFDGPLRARSLR
jgi:hypothetical protein